MRLRAKKAESGGNSAESRPVSTREADAILKRAVERERKTLRLPDNDKKSVSGQESS
jgi:hypothetical protein